MFCIPYADDYVIRVDNHTPAEDDDLVTTSKLVAIGIVNSHCPLSQILPSNTQLAANQCL